MAAACSLLTVPQLQVAEAAAALGDGWSRARLAVLLGVSQDDGELAAALRRLTDLVLVCGDGDAYAAAHLRAMWPHPLGLGPRAAELLAARNVSQLRALGKVYGCPVNGRDKDQLIGEIVAWLARPDNVRGLVARALPTSAPGWT